MGRPGTKTDGALNEDRCQQQPPSTSLLTTPSAGEKDRQTSIPNVPPMAAGTSFPGLINQLLLEPSMDMSLCARTWKVLPCNTMFANRCGRQAARPKKIRQDVAALCDLDGLRLTALLMPPNCELFLLVCSRRRSRDVRWYRGPTVGR